MQRSQRRRHRQNRRSFATAATEGKEDTNAAVALTAVMRSLQEIHLQPFAEREGGEHPMDEVTAVPDSHPSLSDDAKKSPAETTPVPEEDEPTDMCTEKPLPPPPIAVPQEGPTVKDGFPAMAPVLPPVAVTVTPVMAGPVLCQSPSDAAPVPSPTESTGSHESESVVARCSTVGNGSLQSLENRKGKHTRVRFKFDHEDSKEGTVLVPNVKETTVTVETTKNAARRVSPCPPVAPFKRRDGRGVLRRLLVRLAMVVVGLAIGYLLPEGRVPQLFWRR